jgi:hypothetical protein
MNPMEVCCLWHYMTEPADNSKAGPTSYSTLASFNNACNFLTKTSRKISSAATGYMPISGLFHLYGYWSFHLFLHWSHFFCQLECISTVTWECMYHSCSINSTPTYICNPQQCQLNYILHSSHILALFCGHTLYILLKYQFSPVL